MTIFHDNYDIKQQFEYLHLKKPKQNQHLLKKTIILLKGDKKLIFLKVNVYFV